MAQMLGRREYDSPRRHAVDLVDRWRWPVTVVVCTLIAAVTGCYLSGRSVAGLLDELVVPSIVTTMVSACAAAIRLLTSVRQIGTIDRRTGESLPVGGERVASASDVAALREDVASLLTLAGAERTPRHADPSWGYIQTGQEG